MGKSKQTEIWGDKKKVQNAKINYLQVIPNRIKVFNFNESNILLHEIEKSKIT